MPDSVGGSFIVANVLERHYSTSAAIRREYLCLALTILGAADTIAV